MYDFFSYVKFKTRRFTHPGVCEFFFRKTAERNLRPFFSPSKSFFGSYTKDALYYLRYDIDFNNYPAGAIFRVVPRTRRQVPYRRIRASARITVPKSVRLEFKDGNPFVS